MGELSGLANRFDCFIFDLDGVVYRGSRPLPHAIETLKLLHAHGREVYFLTNNSGHTRQQYAEKLCRMGFTAEPEQFITSAWVTGLYLQEHLPNARVFVVGEPGLKQELEGFGFELAEEPDQCLPDAVVVGIDRQFSYQRLAQAQSAILRGARFIATNTDATYPAEDRLMPGAGAIVSAIATATGKSPVVLGKPNPAILTTFLSHHPVLMERTLLVGDRLDTDIALANLLHIPSALVLTGVAQKTDLENAPIEHLPNWVLNDLSGLLTDGVDSLLIHALPNRV